MRARIDIELYKVRECIDIELYKVRARIDYEYESSLPAPGPEPEYMVESTAYVRCVLYNELGAAARLLQLSGHCLDDVIILTGCHSAGGVDNRPARSTCLNTRPDFNENSDGEVKT